MESRKWGKEKWRRRKRESKGWRRSGCRGIGAVLVAAVGGTEETGTYDSRLLSFQGVPNPLLIGWAGSFWSRIEAERRGGGVGVWRASTAGFVGPVVQEAAPMKATGKGNWDLISGSSSSLCVDRELSRSFLSDIIQNWRWELQFQQSA